MDLEQTCLGHTEPVTGVTFSFDGRYLISGGRDRTVRLWDTATGQIKLLLDGGSRSVLSVASSRNGLSIAAGNADGTTRLWQISQIVGAESVPSP